jgi:hypothetical protein
MTERRARAIAIECPSLIWERQEQNAFRSKNAVSLFQCPDRIGQVLEYMVGNNEILAPIWKCV